MCSDIRYISSSLNWRWLEIKLDTVNRWCWLTNVRGFLLNTIQKQLTLVL